MEKKANGSSIHTDKHVKTSPATDPEAEGNAKKVQLPEFEVIHLQLFSLPFHIRHQNQNFEPVTPPTPIYQINAGAAEAGGRRRSSLAA